MTIVYLLQSILFLTKIENRGGGAKVPIKTYRGVGASIWLDVILIIKIRLY